jgi:uncharacterized iron-regulated protein
MTAAKRAERDELIAKDRRIDDLVAQAEELVTDLNTTVADMKRILAAAQANVEMQQQIRDEGRGQR